MRAISGRAPYPSSAVHGHTIRVRQFVPDLSPAYLAIRGQVEHPDVIPVRIRHVQPSLVRRQPDTVRLDKIPGHQPEFSIGAYGVHPAEIQFGRRVLQPFRQAVRWIREIDRAIGTDH